MKDRLTTEDEPQTVQIAPRSTLEDDVLVADEMLVEEISIDGMCGVY